MSSPEIPHLQDEELLRLLDGELPAHEATALESHMAACWTCRTRMEEFESSIGEYVRYRANALKPVLPPPPRPWDDLRPKLEEADRSMAAGRVVPIVPAVRARYWFGVRPSYWIAAAACVILGVVLVGRFEHAPAVRAAELLRKASAVPAGFEPNRRIQVKSRHRTVSRPALLTPAAASEAADLKQIFDAARFSWEEPLSARSYAVWHDQLTEKFDEARSVDRDESAGVAVYVIKTSTAASTLRNATLTLRARDLRPIREMLEFNSDTVEITEDVPEPNGSKTAETATRTVPRPASAPARTIVPTPATPAVHQELQVFAALHRVGADLGEPIEIRRSGSQLLVIGTGLTATRKEQLNVVLGEISGVAVHFDDATANARAGNSPSDRAGSATAPMQARLQALLGDRESAEDFTNHALDASDAVMARVHALRALARAFPTEAQSSLTAEDSGLLRTLRDDHAAALEQRIADLQRVLKPVTASAGPASGVETAASWQSAAEALFTAAQRLDDSLNAALAGPAPGVDDSGFGTLGAALGSLQARFSAYQRTGR
jgi:anti-sigma factor RsiW